jgi:hypothetical protein
MGILEKWRAERGGAMFINLVSDSLMVTSIGEVRRLKRGGSCGGEALGSTMNIIYGTQNDNLPAGEC